MVINDFLKESSSTFKLYVDMDGVLTDFEQAFLDLDKGTVDEFDDSEDILEVVKIFGGEKFWSEMPWMKDGKVLWQFVKQFQPTLLSSPSSDPKSRTGKKKWVQKNISRNQPLILAWSNSKQKYSGANCILIDDKERTIKQWRQKGGIGILHKNAKDTIKQLKTIMK